MNDTGKKIKVFTGTAHPELARGICTELGIGIGEGLDFRLVRRIRILRMVAVQQRQFFEHRRLFLFFAVIKSAPFRKKPIFPL